ncbi:MarR family winged helix-turn-helix transcriptional regulator [Methylobacterium sp. Leaf99]|uniref:MarR family winged helix-turn-helix transcriptional regulator n=1 Tax=Methylobacterium sp. Leaf99 TaxID=1736251 RepID=UPI001FCD4E1E|nr:MarR family transcriptional regulator [Methylobacterium sp. Leaf99]
MENAAIESPATESPGDDLIELLFFAYRDFVGDPDRILAQYGFGRAHHRVLHFVDRYPGLTIAELLDILRITKQSLNRVLKDLIEQDYIVQKTGTSDRRQRLLFCTERGTALAGDLIRVQTRRVTRALADPEDGILEVGTSEDKSSASGASSGKSSEGGTVSAQNFLLAMIEPEERATVRRLMARRARSAA